MILLPERVSPNMYAFIKEVADHRVQVIVACCTKKPARQGGNQAPAITTDLSIMGNMLMKINLKSSKSSADRRLTAKTVLLEDKTMIVGIDVVSSVRTVEPYPANTKLDTLWS